MNRFALFAVCATLIALTLAAAAGGAHPLPGARHCPVFPSENPWNQRVDRLPVAGNSSRLIASIGLGNPVHPDFGSGLDDDGPTGIPITLVSKHTRRVPVRFGYASQSDRGPYPLPPGVAICVSGAPPGLYLRRPLSAGRAFGCA